MKTSGVIYKIINKINKKYYVGRTNNAKARWKKHRWLLRHSKHENSNLQKDWNQYGELEFEFIIIEATTDSIIELETLYISKFIEDRNNGIDDCYNISISSNGIEIGDYTDEIRKKLSDHMKLLHYQGKINNNQHRKATAESNRARIWTNESREKSRNARLGRKLSTNTKRKMSELRSTGEYRKRVSDSVKRYYKDKPMSDEHKRKISETLKLRHSKRLDF